jgi:PIN domain nuclease of toxin-antitoxin system
VQEALGSACISAVNLSETIAKLAEYGKPAEEIAYHIDLLQIPVVAFDEEQARMAASLREPTRAAGLSLGDRACLALAKKLSLPAYTTEKKWSECNVGVKVVKIR